MTLGAGREKSLHKTLSAILRQPKQINQVLDFKRNISLLAEDLIADKRHHMSSAWAATPMHRTHDSQPNHLAAIPSGSHSCYATVP